MVDTSDLLPKTPRYLKVPLIILNAILWILGIVLIACGGFALSKLSHLDDIINVSLPAGIIVIGVFFLVLTFIGCYVAYKEKLVGLVFYTVFMLVLLVCLIGVGGGAFTYRNNVEKPVGIAWYKATADEHKIAEDYFECCCWDLTKPINESCGTSCYTIDPINNQTIRVDGKPYCNQTITEYIQKNLYVAGAAGVTIGVIEFVSMLFALFLIVLISKLNIIKPTANININTVYCCQRYFGNTSKKNNNNKSQRELQTYSLLDRIRISNTSGSGHSNHSKNQKFKILHNNNNNSKSTVEASAKSYSDYQKLLEEMSSFNIQNIRNFRWVKSSPDELESAEKKMLEGITTPYEQSLVKVGDEYVNTIKAGSGDPLVLIHGYGAGVGFWCANIDELAQHYTVYAIDLVGFGRSSRPDVSYLKTPDEAEEFWTKSILDWSEQMGLENFNLLGHSLGGYLSASFSLKYPEKVKKLVLADAWGIPHRPTDFEDKIPLPLKLLGKVITPDVPLALLRACGPLGPDLIYRFRQDLLMKFSGLYPNDDLKFNPLNPNRVAQYIYHTNAQSPATGEYLFKLLSLPFGWAVNPLIDRVKAMHPGIDVTLLYGSNSWIDHSSGHKLKEEMKNIKDIVIIEQSGHHIYIDNQNHFHQSIVNAIPKKRRDELFDTTFIADLPNHLLKKIVLNGLSNLDCVCPNLREVSLFDLSLSSVIKKCETQICLKSYANILQKGVELKSFNNECIMKLFSTPPDKVSGFEQTYDYIDSFDNPNMKIPSGVKNLTIAGDGFGQLPDLSMCNARSIVLFTGGVLEIKKDTLPKMLKSLYLSSTLQDNLEPGIFPDGIEEISFAESNSQFYQANLFPIGLKRLCLHSNNIEPFTDGSLPSTLESLAIDLNCFLSNTKYLKHLGSLSSLTFSYNTGAPSDPTKLRGALSCFANLSSVSSIPYKH
ncbi:hypothetical protein PPL_04531 [Heterostelium album PN500]|uniref:AB hydrolase-1 domain-containing protein n=1 Tax=Heterostelium pallidum (strain ATCC 26659 / Pp 5 / PN500) TaxID=670386 RepID=D3B7U3_HETP5|nr:hypothetical protein PPL_04531 [Heterostelium album PN500]EFA82836.1 hypothetical protein PPL_04531 [Heterostelium album PN500]|eukprot:XP_020434953.1 hypothetical protein PPL_04531 [Heterostelium album PN500]